MSRKITTLTCCMLLLVAPMLGGCGNTTSSSKPAVSTENTMPAKADIEAKIKAEYSKQPAIQKATKLFGKDFVDKVASCVADKVMHEFSPETVKKILNDRIDNENTAKFVEINKKCGEMVGRDWAAKQNQK